MKIKKLFYAVLAISIFSSFVLETGFNVNAKTETWGSMPKWAVKDNGFKEGEKDNKKADKILKKRSDEFSKTHDKNIEYDLDGSIPKDPNNISVAKKYKKELPKLEKQLKSLKQGTKQYKTLNHEIELHKTVIKAIFG